MILYFYRLPSEKGSQAEAAVPTVASRARSIRKYFERAPATTSPTLHSRRREDLFRIVTLKLPSLNRTDTPPSEEAAAAVVSFFKCLSILLEKQRQKCRSLLLSYYLVDLRCRCNLKRSHGHKSVSNCEPVCLRHGRRRRRRCRLRRRSSRHVTG